MKEYLTSKETYWNYPQVSSPPKGVKMLLLNAGGCTIIGNWTEGMIAWLPLPKRNHVYEGSLKENK